MKERLILITNDVGIHANGLERLAEAASAYGQVWVIAPDGQRSAVSHSVTLYASVDVFPYDYPIKGVRAFTCSGTPADCVRIGILYLMPAKPDILLSGINFGYNMGSDIQYSGTVGAAFEKKGDGSTFSFYLVGNLLLVGAAVILVALAVLIPATGQGRG